MNLGEIFKFNKRYTLKKLRLLNGMAFSVPEVTFN